MKLDLLAIAAHPDDVELSCSGTIVKHIKKGYKAGIVDLTRGELGTRGTADTRDVESKEASSIMGIHARENLRLADGFFQNDPGHQMPIIRAIRKYRPQIVLANAIRDRHPDHARAADLIAQAAFLAGLRKIETEDNGQPQEAWRPQAIYHYNQDYYNNPDVVVDISDVIETKMKAILAYKSQFHQPGEDQSNEPQTPISSPEFREFLKARMRDYGRLIGAEFGEGFKVSRAIGADDLLQLR